MTRLLFTTTWLLCSITCASAAPLPPTVRAEVGTLLARLQSSGCQFNRNGAWYKATEAQAHLLKKLDYLEGKGQVQTTEQFIELAASESSTTGQPYAVKCGATAQVPSKRWLTDQLKALRATPANTSVKTK